MTAAEAGLTVEDRRTFEVAGLSELRHRPWIVLTELNPWRMVVGSDVPTAVLYEDGLAVYHRGEGTSAEALSVHAPEQVKRVAEAIASGGFMSVPVRSRVIGATDQPRVVILARKGERWKYAEVYGINRKGEPSMKIGSPPAAPRAFVEAYQALLNFDAPGAGPWVPAEIELLLGDFSHTKKPARSWPKAIPPPPSDMVVPKRGVHRQLLPGRLEPDVQRFLKSLGPGEAVAFGDKKLSMRYRRVVTEEPYIAQVRQCAGLRILSSPAKSGPAGCR